ILTRSYSPLVVKCLDLKPDDIVATDAESWTLRDGVIDSPVVELDDMVEGLIQRFNKDRRLRNRLRPKAVLSLPLISKHEFSKRFSADLNGTTVIWQDSLPKAKSLRAAEKISDTDFSLALSILQTAHALARPGATPTRTKAQLMGDAIAQLEKNIMLLDAEQQKAALNIPPDLNASAAWQAPGRQCF